jgi:hypothetical protein
MSRQLYCASGRSMGRARAGRRGNLLRGRSEIAWAVEQQRRSDSRKRVAEENPLRRIVWEARQQAEVLQLLLAPQVLTKLLRGHRVNLEKMVHDFAWEPLHNPRRYERRFGDPTRMGATQLMVERTHDLVLAVEETLRPLAGKRVRGGPVREALLRAGIPATRLEAVEAHGGLDPVPVRGLRRRALSIVGVAERRATGTVRGHVEAWKALWRLLGKARLRELGNYFVEQRRAAFRASWSGQARLAYLRGERRRRERLTRLKRDAKRRGQLRFLRSIGN